MLDLMELFARKKDEQNDEGSQESVELKMLPELPQRFDERVRIQSIYKFIIPKVSKGLKGYTLIGFYAFFFVVMCFFINVLMDLVLDQLSPIGQHLYQRVLFIGTTSVIFLAVLIDSFFVLQLFWEVIQAFHKENRVSYFWMRLVLLIIDLCLGLLMLALTNSGITGFLEYLFLTSFAKAGIVSILGSIYLLCFVYMKRNKKIFPEKERTVWKIVVFWGVLFMLCAMYVCPFLYLISGSSWFSIGWAVFVPFTSCIVLTFLYCRGSREEDSGYLMKPAVVVIMILAFVVVMVVSFAADHQCDKSCQLKLPPHNSQSRQSARAYRAIPENPQVPGYQICSKRWGSLTITDMVFFADLAYKISKVKDTEYQNLTGVLDVYFKDRSTSNWTVEVINPYKPSFYHIRNSADRINVVGIRGTNDLRDWIENAKIWNEVLIYKVLFSIVPFNGIIPDNVVATYIQSASVMDYVYSKYNRTYIDVIENYLKRNVNRQRRQHEEFYLVGHSLGGGLAKIIGSRLKIQAIAISSPGDIYNHKKYSYTLDDLQKYTTSFGARDDFISKLDKEGGLVQHVRKDNSNGPFEAHSIKNTYCDIKKKCTLTTPIPCKTQPKP